MIKKIPPILPLRKGEKKIAVAMSGGVDSSVAAALLKKRGFEVEGIFMRLFDAQNKNSERGARAVAKKLDVKFRVLDLRKEFKKRVIDYFLWEFKAGRTPNPCAVCNQQIKFGLLLEKAMNPSAGGGADFVATGHYARLRREFPISNFQFSNKSKIQNPKSKIRYKLLAARDEIKDQSYFLYNLTQEKLRKILFPLGDYKKSEVYKMAEKWQLPYKRGESVDICFIGKGGHRDFLKKHLDVKPGKIIDVNGKTLSKHQGIWLYTIGQRADVGGPGPFYVVKLDAKNNAVIVSNKFREEALYKKVLIAEKVNWISGRKPELPLKCLARIRYGHAAVPCVVLSLRVRRLEDEAILTKYHGIASLSSFARNDYLVDFRNPQRAITPGQSIVFYKRNEILGGGVIR